MSQEMPMVPPRALALWKNMEAVAGLKVITWTDKGLTYALEGL